MFSVPLTGKILVNINIYCMCAHIYVQNRTQALRQQT